MTFPPVDQRSIERSSIEAPTTDESIESSPYASSLEEGHSLPPTDSGKGAWLALAGCCVVQTPVWGFSLVTGIFQSYYASHPGEFKGDDSSAALIGTTLTGILYLSSPVLFTLMARYPRLRPWCGPIGLVLLVASVLASSFIDNVAAIIALQGVIQAIGAGLLFAPTTLYLDEWFVRRRGLAYGIMWAAKSATGVALPLITEPSLEHFGHRTVLQAWAVFSAIVTAPLLYYIKPRIPVSRTTTVRNLNLKFLRSTAFWLFSIGNILQSLGYFLPTAYLPSYANAIDLSATTATLMLALLNGVSVLGSVALGPLNDRIGVGRVTLLSTIGSTISVFFIWGFADHVAMLALFAAGYGFFAGAFSSTWPGILTEVKNECPEMDTGFVFGLLAGGRGIGNVVSGPLSVALLKQDLGDVLGGYGTQYGPMILFTGVSALLGGLGSVYGCARRFA